MKNHFFYNNLKMNHEFLMNHAKKQYIPGIRLKKKKKRVKVIVLKKNHECFRTQQKMCIFIFFGLKRNYKKTLQISRVTSLIFSSVRHFQRIPPKRVFGKIIKITQIS